jgi:hypothetical protein
MEFEFCTAATRPAPARTASLAALGVLSHEPRVRLRTAIRATWLPDLPPSIAARFVLRGLELQEPNAIRAEAAHHADVLFVRARSVMLRENGPLQSLVLWFECARAHFAVAKFIGKADDDVWIRPSGWAALLEAVHAGRVVPKGAHAYIGALESYHWVLNTEAPIGWRHFPYAARCKVDHPSHKPGERYVGPFAFAKGASFFLSAHSAGRLVADHAAQVQRITGSDAARCFHGSQMWFEAWCCGTGIASINKKHCRHHYKTLGKRCPARKRGGEHNPCVASARSAGKSSNPAWDDVWTGYALSRTAALGGPLYLVNLHYSLFRDAPGFKARAGAISWHSQIDRDMPRRAAAG